MAESYIQLAPDSTGKKAHTFQRAVGANAVEDEVVLRGMPYLASYRISTATAISVATSSSHLLQIMAGASLNVYVVRIQVYLVSPAGAATNAIHELFRLSSAGTGGTAITPAPMDTADAASGATAMTLPSAKGTESTRMGIYTVNYLAAASTATAYDAFKLTEWEWDDDGAMKFLKIPAGTSNGIALKATNGVATATVNIMADIIEANF